MRAKSISRIPAVVLCLMLIVSCIPFQASAETITETVSMTEGDVIKEFAAADSECVSSDPSVAWVDNDGSLNALKTGTATITVPNGDDTTEYTVTVSDYTDGSAVAGNLKILARFLYKVQEQFGLRLASFNGGKLHNAIPRDGVVVFGVEEGKKEDVRVLWNVFTSEIEEEFHVTEKTMQFNMESTQVEKVLPSETSTKLIQALQAVDNGVFAMCQDEELAWLVETSNNVASVETTDNIVRIVASQRSNVMSALDNQAATIKAVFQLAGAEVVQGDGYPAWRMNPNSALTALTVETYKKLFGKEPKVLGIHAGLECGLFSEKYPHLDMVSFGPTLRGVHSPDERLLIPTVQMVWNHLLEILKNIPA